MVEHQLNRVNFTINKMGVTKVQYDSYKLLSRKGQQKLLIFDFPVPLGAPLDLSQPASCYSVGGVERIISPSCSAQGKHS